MNDVFVNLLIGHLLGDFVFQNKWMAVNKSASNFKSFVHVSIYTLCVLLMTKFNFIWAAVIFIPHFLIDRFSLADIWLDFINGRSLKDFVKNGHLGIDLANGMAYYENYRTLRGGFTAVVYTVTDNTFHLICLWFGYRFLFN